MKIMLNLLEFKNELKLTFFKFIFIFIILIITQLIFSITIYSESKEILYEKMYDISKNWDLTVYKIVNNKEEEIFNDKIIFVEINKYINKPDLRLKIEKWINIKNSFLYYDFIGLYFGYSTIKKIKLFVNYNFYKEFTPYNEFFIIKLPNILLEYHKLKNEKFIKLTFIIDCNPYNFTSGKIIIGDYNYIENKIFYLKILNRYLSQFFNIITFIFAISFLLTSRQLKSNIIELFIKSSILFLFFSFYQSFRSVFKFQYILEYFIEFKLLYISIYFLNLFIFSFTDLKNKILDLINKYFLLSFFIEFFIINNFYKIILLKITILVVILNIILLLIFLIRKKIFSSIENQTANYDLIIAGLLISLIFTVSGSLPSINNAPIKSLKFILITYQLFVIIIILKLFEILIKSFEFSNKIKNELSKKISRLERMKSFLEKNRNIVSDLLSKYKNISEKISSYSFTLESTTNNLIKLIDKIKIQETEIVETENKILRKSEDIKKSIDSVFLLLEKTDTTLFEINKSIETVKQHSLQIEQIVEQTSNLALNSSIEAYKASFLSKGFSVISTEIRKLAIKSQNFSSDVKERLMNLTENINETTQKVKKFIEQYNQYMENFEKFAELIKINTNSHEEMHIALDDIKSSSIEIKNMTDILKIQTDEIFKNTKTLIKLIDEKEN